MGGRGQVQWAAGFVLLGYILCKSLYSSGAGKFSTRWREYFESKSSKKEWIVAIESLWLFCSGGGGGGGGGGASPAGVLERGGGGFPRLMGSDPCIRHCGGEGGTSLAPFSGVWGGGYSLPGSVLA